MIALRGATLVLSDRVVDSATLLLDGPRIADIVLENRATGAADECDACGCIIVPGFVDVHVHGVEGLDTLDALDGAAPIAAIAERLPRYGVTAFCPTTVACAPPDLARVLTAVDAARRAPPRGARVLPAHLESNFINPTFRGAQPLACLRLPPAPGQAAAGTDDFAAADILATIAAHPGATAIVTMACELPGGLDLVRSLVGMGLRVSLGHSGATFDEARAGFDAGARHATHLFNRMSPLHHRDPGLVGAVLERDDVDAELICDGYHVHWSAARLALRLKSVARMLAITDGTAGSGLAVGAQARLGGRTITVRDTAAFLDEGTLAGSTLTMDRAFRNVVSGLGCSLVEAARLCASNPAAAVGETLRGRLTPGAFADFVVLDEDLRVLETWVEGRCAWSARGAGQAIVQRRP